MWFRFGFHPWPNHAWAAFGPLQLIWNRGDGKSPLLWLTTRTPKLLIGSF